MALYEHVFIARQDLSTAQANTLIEEFSNVLTENSGKIVATEYWGLKTMAYKIKKNRKGHYGFIRSDAPHSAVSEMERLMSIHEDILRVMTVKVKEHQSGPTAVMVAKSAKEERRRERGQAIEE